MIVGGGLGAAIGTGLVRRSGRTPAAVGAHVDGATDTPRHGDGPVAAVHPTSEVPEMPASPVQKRSGGELGQLAEESVAALRVGVLVLDRNGQVVLANPAAHRLGLVRTETGGLTAHSVLRTLGGRVTQPGQQRDVDLELNRRDLPGAADGDGPDWFGVRVRLVGLAGGYVAMEAEDVTEAHRVARVRRDFVANVSHELKTPVGALQLLGEALVDALDDPEAARRFAERIAHESSRLGRLVTELLELSRLQGAEPLPDPLPVAADRIVAEVVDRTRTTAQAKEITVATAGRRGLIVYGNETQLATALANLVENAIAYSPEGTTVTIDVRRGGDAVLVSVTDQGIGIEPHDLDRIFERFYRADKARSRATGGTGLGLAIVKHIATNHGGRVDVTSTVGRGSTFTLRLPARPSRAIAVEHNPGEIAEDIGQAEVQLGAVGGGPAPVTRGTP
ncbi:sensor histidine kinase [Actinocatenispora rupis]|uniref:sensor histidine kinase n=1 Tax=Actinocatenispora rupis TaxID=519421 RepID=UPI003571711F